MLPLEDDPGDILRKAMNGRGFTSDRLAVASGVPVHRIAAWIRGEPCEATREQSDALAHILDLKPSAFADAVARRWHPHSVRHLHIDAHVQAPHPSNGYVYFLDSCKRAVLVDPAGIAEPIFRVLADKAYHLQYILVTHKHADHCDAVAEIAAAFPDARIIMHPLDAHALGPLESSVYRVRDGDTIPVGDDTVIRALHTPGHTDGSTSYLLQSTLFSGDTLFAGSVGGAYGELSTYDDILHNIEGRLFTLPEETIVMPGHGPPTTIAEERVHNPFFPHHS